MSKITKREQRIDELFEMPMLALSVLVLLLILIPVVFTLSPVASYFVAVLNVFVWAALYFELIVKFYVSSNWKRTFRNNWFLCVIAAAPTLVAFRAIALLRLASALRLLRLQSILTKVSKRIRQLIINIEYFLITVIAFVFMSALLMWQIELGGGGVISSFAEALWWSVITVTTIGYGDVVPSTDTGKIFGAFVGVLGSILFTVFVARITVFFIKNTR